MAKYIPAGTVEIWAVDTIADRDNPTVAELNAGTRLTAFISGGVTIDDGSNPVPAGTLASRRIPTVAGTIGGGQSSLNGVLRDDVAADDDAWTFLTQGKVTNLVIADYGISGANTTFAAGDKVSIYPIEIFARSRGDLAFDQLHTFDVPFGITADPSEDVTVAA